ncbi:amino acid permease [candidate division KSB1 bacterium]|nr:amino acid permease [candidate division KSB1 bacterium]
MDDHLTPELKRVIGLPDATAMVVGTIIGASIFVQPSEITSHVPSIAGVLLVWIISGILTLFGALVCAELASIFTQSGGVYVYLKETYSPALGFLWGWAMFWTMHSGIIAAIAVICARYVAYFIPMGDAATKGVAIAVILILSAVNYLGVKHGSTLQALFTLGKVAVILAMIVLGFALGPRVPVNAAPADLSAAPINLQEFALALVAGLFAFGGWHMVTYNAEETVNPRQTIPRALVLGTMIVTVCYIALNAVYLHVLPLATVAASTRVAADAANAVLGFGGGAIMSGLVIFSTFGALSGIILSGPRVYFAMARDGLLFRWLGEIHPQFHTPHRAILVQAIWSAVLVGTGTYRALFTRVIYTEWIFFGVMAIGLFILRRRPNVARQYAVWGYPLVPGAFIVSAFAIVLNQIRSDAAESMLGLSFVLIGLPVYYFWAKHNAGKSQPNQIFPNG